MACEGQDCTTNSYTWENLRKTAKNLRLVLCRSGGTKQECLDNPPSVKEVAEALTDRANEKWPKSTEKSTECADCRCLPKNEQPEKPVTWTFDDVVTNNSVTRNTDHCECEWEASGTITVTGTRIEGVCEKPKDKHVAYHVELSEFGVAIDSADIELTSDFISGVEELLRSHTVKKG